MEVTEQCPIYNEGMEHPKEHSYEDVKHPNRNLEKIYDLEEIAIINEGRQVKVRTRSSGVTSTPIDQDGSEQTKQSPINEEEAKEENVDDPISSAPLTNVDDRENIEDIKIEEGSDYIDHFACPHCPRRFKINSLFLKHIHIHTIQGKFFICPQCSIALKYDWQLSIHLIGHRTPKKYGVFISSHCSREFDHKYGWQRHVYEHEKEGSEIVHICHEHKRCFRSSRTFRRHRTKCHIEEVQKEKKADKELEVKTFICQYCNKEIMKRRRLTHLKIHEGEVKNHLCSYCNKGFSQKGNLIRHLLLHTDTNSVFIDGKWKCLPCDTSFCNKRNLERHKVRCPKRLKTSVSSKSSGHELKTSVSPKSSGHELKTSVSSKSSGHELNTSASSKSTGHELKTSVSSKSIGHKCPTCKRVHASEKALQNHMKIHTKIERKYFCSVCNKSFDHKFPRDRHERRSHPKNSRKINGNIDESSNKSKKSNKNKETSSKNSRVTSKRASGEKHSETSEEKPSRASGNEPSICLICQKAFARKANLSRHMKVHSEEREMFTCHICDKVMTTQNSLDTHLSSHLEKDIEEAYLCSECMKIFASRAGLKEHIEAVHVKEKMYQCPLCPEKFSVKNLMQKHFLAHREEDVLSCPHCPKYYENQEDMNWHIIRSHQNIVHKFSYRDEFYYKLRILEEDPENIDRGEPESTTNRKSKTGKINQKTNKMRKKKSDVSDEQENDLMEEDPIEDEFPLDISMDEENSPQKCSVILQHQYTYSGIDDRPLTLWL